MTILTEDSSSLGPHKERKTGGGEPLSEGLRTSAVPVSSPSTHPIVRQVSGICLVCIATYLHPDIENNQINRFEAVGTLGTSRLGKEEVDEHE